MAIVTYPVLDPFESRQLDTLEFIGHLLEPDRLVRIRIPCTYSIPLARKHIQLDVSPCTFFFSPMSCDKNERCIDNLSLYHGDRSERQRIGGIMKEKWTEQSAQR